MTVETALPIEFSDAAARKVKALVTEEENPELKLRVYVTGGGCSGFQYGFTYFESRARYQCVGGRVYFHGVFTFINCSKNYHSFHGTAII